jgi:hypothetical protein
LILPYFVPQPAENRAEDGAKQRSVFGRHRDHGDNLRSKPGPVSFRGPPEDITGENASIMEGHRTLRPKAELARDANGRGIRRIDVSDHFGQGERVQRVVKARHPTRSSDDRGRTVSRDVTKVGSKELTPWKG